MYDILLKWGLDSLSKSVLGKSDQEVSVMLEAIKAKNTLVVERFKFSWNTCQDIIALSIDVEKGLDDFAETIKDYEWKTKRGRKKIMWNLNIFHAKYARQLKKIRCNYDSTNDLLSAYSSQFITILHLETFEKIADKHNFTTRSQCLRLYRGLWQFYARVMSSLVRVTSSDLRFWLTDEPYIKPAFEWSEKDYKGSVEWLSKTEGYGNWHFLSLETPGGLSDFWEHIAPNK